MKLSCLWTWKVFYQPICCTFFFKSLSLNTVKFSLLLLTFSNWNLLNQLQSNDIRHYTFQNCTWSKYTSFSPVLFLFYRKFYLQGPDWISPSEAMLILYSVDNPSVCTPVFVYAHACWIQVASPLLMILFQSYCKGCIKDLSFCINIIKDIYLNKKYSYYLLM